MNQECDTLILRNFKKEHHGSSNYAHLFKREIKETFGVFPLLFSARFVLYLQTRAHTHTQHGPTFHLILYASCLIFGVLEG